MSSEEAASSRSGLINKNGDQKSVPGSRGNVERATHHASASIGEIEEVLEEEEEKERLRREVGCSSRAVEEEKMVYVSVGKSETSMNALIWVLNNVAEPFSTTVHLVHVFPQLKWVTNPLGNAKVPRSMVSKEHLDRCIKVERSRRRRFLETFIDKCTQQQVKVDTILIESDSESTAILELISVLHIQLLVIGVSKSNLRKLGTGRGTGTVDQVLQKAPEWCEIKLICEDREAQTPNASPSSMDSATQTPSRLISSIRELPSFSYCCFKAYVDQ